MAESFFVAYQYAVFFDAVRPERCRAGGDGGPDDTGIYTRARVHSESNCMYSLGGYLSSPMSTRDARARQINAGTRKVFAEKLYSRSVPGSRTSGALARHLIAADTASEASAQCRDRVAKERVFPTG